MNLTRLSCALLFVFTVCWSTGSAASASTGPIQHIVLCWLKNPSEENRKQVIETTMELSSIQGVRELRAGPVLPSEREVVDDSFDVGISMSFRNREDMETYLNHEEHLRRVREVLLPLCGKVRIHDFTY